MSNGKKRVIWGQHFLKNIHVVERMMSQADIQPDELVVEIGPGKGVVTKELINRGAEVIALEIDQNLGNTLMQKLEGYPIQFIFGDALDYDWSGLGHNRKYKLISSLPYQITSPLIHKIYDLTYAGAAPTVVCLLIQYEVARKLCPLKDKTTYFSMLSQAMGGWDYVMKVGKSNFGPAPEVDGALITLTPLSNETIENPVIFKKMLHRGYSTPRKMINKQFPISLLVRSEIESSARPEDISFNQWLKLYKNLTREGEGGNNF